MENSTKKLLLIAGLVALVYFFVLRKRPTSTKATTPISHGNVHFAGEPADQVVDGALSNILNWTKRTTSRPDLSAGVADDELDWFEDDFNVYTGTGGRHGNGSVDFDAVQRRFFRQMWLPASRARLSDLTWDDFHVAWALLSYAVDWKDSRWRDSERATKDQADYAYDWKVAMQVMGYVTGIVASFVPLVGGAIGAGNKANTDSSTAAFAQIEQDIRSKLADPGAHPITDRMQPPAEIWVRSNKTAELGTELRDDGQGRYWARRSLIGYLWGTDGDSVTRALRWNCRELEAKDYDDGASHGLVNRTNRRAYVYRALDLICCYIFPYHGEVTYVGADANNDAIYDRKLPEGLYQYKNPHFGRIYGSIFPPTVEDYDLSIGGSGAGGFVFSGAAAFFAAGPA